MRRAFILILLCAPLVLSVSCAPKSETQATAPKPSPAPLMKPAPPSPAEEMLKSVNKKPVEDSSPLYVQPNGLYLRECPSKECKVIATLLKGQAVKPLFTCLGWLEVSVEDKGLTGWLGSRHVAKSLDAAQEAPLAADQEIAKPEATDAQAASSATPASGEASASAPSAAAAATAPAEQSAKPMKAPPPPKEEFSPGTKAPTLKTK